MFMVSLIHIMSRNYWNKKENVFFNNSHFSETLVSPFKVSRLIWNFRFKQKGPFRNDTNKRGKKRVTASLGVEKLWEKKGFGEKGVAFICLGVFLREEEEKWRDYSPLLSLNPFSPLLERKRQWSSLKFEDELKCQLCS